jgi:hypothetical protein
MVGANGKEHIEAYPLAWPDGWRRTSAERRTRANFHERERQHYDYGNGSSGSYSKKRELSVADATTRVLLALERMGLHRDNIVISTNLELRLDGLPRSNQRPPSDPGAAVYWRKGKETRCMAIDRYDRVEGNLAAIAATLEAMRAIDRYGGAEILNRAFTGFVALPQPEQWWQVLGVSSRASRDEIDDAYRSLAMKHHPDRGGDSNEMSRINGARDRGYEQLSGV